MKKILLIYSLFLGLFLVSNTVKSGTITIDPPQVPQINISQSGGPCDFGQLVYYGMWGKSTGYNYRDSVNISIAFGDGTFDSAIALIDTGGTFYMGFRHTYSSSGLYTIQFIATATDLAADTLTLPNGVIFSDTCGNINGKVFVDQNNDCILNASELPLELIRVNAILGNTVISSDWTDSSGKYSISVPPNQTYTVSLAGVNGYTPICPSTGSLTVSTIPSVANDFALNCTNAFDLYANAHGGSVPGHTGPLYISVFNSFCSNKSGVLKVIFNDSLYSYSGNASAVPNSINGDTVEWSFSNISNLANNNFDLNIGGYTDTTAQIGDTVCITLIVEPIVSDSNPTNNIKKICFPVRTSYDPNIKQVQPIGYGNLGKVMPNTELTYTIHFQNTGTFQAFNVYILDTLDTSVLDPTTLQVIGSSDPMVVDIISPTQNTIKFRFDNINLPDSTSNEPESHGWVTYTIQQQPNLANGHVIENSAAIYFDYNPPVITQSTLNTVDNFIVSIEKVSNPSNNFAKIYPNPASGILNIDFDQNNQSYEVYLLDITGKLVRKVRSSGISQQLNVSDINEGIYILELRNQNSERQLNRVIVTRK